MLRRILLLNLLTFIFCFGAVAHSFQPSAVEISLLDGEQFAISFDTDLIALAQQQLQLEGSQDQLISQVRALSRVQMFRLLNQAKQQLQQQTIVYFDQKPQSIEALFAPNVAQIMPILSLDPEVTDYRVKFSGYGPRAEKAKQLKVYLPELLGTVRFQLSRPVRALLSSGVNSEAFNLQQGGATSELAQQLATFVQYAYQGIVHIVPKGLDHILFVLALFLLSTRLSTLLWQVSAFTLAHTVTLALGIYGVVTIPASIVEPLIALSIVYVALENVFYHRLSKWRLLLVFCFGLLHGLGFASVLIEVGLPKSQWLSSLIAFNLGVELGQLSVILLAFLLFGWARNKLWYDAKLVTPLSSVIALMGGYWFIERAFF